MGLNLTGIAETTGHTSWAVMGGMKCLSPTSGLGQTMSRSADSVLSLQPSSAGFLSLFAGGVVVLLESWAIYVTALRMGLPETTGYGIAGLTAAILGGALLIVAVQYLRGELTDTEPKSRLIRAAELTVSISVISALAAIAAVGGLVLGLIGAVVGLEPTTIDGYPLRERLFDWMDRNREFMYNKGQGILPLEP